MGTSERGFVRWGAGAALASVTLLACAGRRSPTPLQALRLWSDTGTAVSMQELIARRPVTVLVFWSAECPCVRRYQRRVDALLDRRTGQVTVLAVSSNAGEPMAQVQRVARQRGVRVPLLRDEAGELAHAVGARTTPTAAVLDERGALRYLGWIDNEREPGDPKREPWLERAIDGVLGGRDDFAHRTPTYGCTITRPLFGASEPACCPSSQEHSPRSP